MKKSIITFLPMNKVRFILVLLIIANPLVFGGDKISTPQIKAWFSDMGDLEKVKIGEFEQNISSAILLEGFRVRNVESEKIGNGGIQFTKKLSTKDRQIVLVELFMPTRTGLKWMVQLTDKGEPWSIPVKVVFDYEANPNTRIWTAWANPKGDVTTGKYTNKEIANAVIRENANSGKDWEDPLQPIRPEDNLFYYGAPYYTYDDPKTAYQPFQGNVFCIPMISFLEDWHNQGISLVQSPRDKLLDMFMETNTSGKVQWTHLNHRLGEGQTLNFGMDIIVHEGDWRAALGSMYKKHRSFFDPPQKSADSIAGTGAYSKNMMDFDVEKYKQMAFSVNWKASNDFPYMGMFLPPVTDAVEWQGFMRSGKEPLISISLLRNYSKQMDDLGFHVLSYFNVTEFGTDIAYPAPPLKSDSPTELWKDPNGYLYTHFEKAILFTPPKQSPFESKDYGLTEPDKPFWTGGKAVVMDPGEPVYRNYLVEQALKHNKLIPDASGICIDGMDWLRMYNHRRDDTISWMGDQPVYSMYVSWYRLMEKLSPIFHNQNKVIFVNNHIKRLELLKHVDGLFDEFTYAGSSLNSAGFLGIKKPVMGWINSSKLYKTEPDRTMQKYLYMGIFPMAPFPGNVRSLRPDPGVESLYFDYGPLLKQLRGKKWVLEPHAVKTEHKTARVNIFKTFQGFAIPIVFADNAQTVQVILKASIFKNRTFTYSAIVPGKEAEMSVNATTNDEGNLLLDVPVNRGCSMLILR